MNKSVLAGAQVSLGALVLGWALAGTSSIVMAQASPPQQAQPSGSALPAVTVTAPEQRRVRTRTSAQSSSSGAARRSQQATRAAASRSTPAAQGAQRIDRINGHVDGYVATSSGSGSKTNTPIRELPQTVNVITADQIRDQGAQTVSQALRYTPGVLAESFGAASRFDAYTQVRGFQADSYIDGTRLPNGSSSTFWASTVIEPYGLERVEVLKGPSSMLYGQTSLGGLVSLTTKRPTDVPVHEIQAQTGSFGRQQIAVDLGGPIDKDQQFLYRLTALVRDSGTQVDYIRDNRVYVAPALTWRPDLDTSLTLLASYQSEWGGKTGFNYVPSQGSLNFNPNGRIPFDRYLGDPNFDQLNRTQGSIGYLFEHRFNDILTVRQNLRYFEVDTDLRALNRSGDTLTNNATTLNRRAFGIDAGAKSIALDNQAEVRFVTGPFSHLALFGLDYRHEDNHYNIGSAGGVPPINVYNPLYGVAITDPGTTNFQLMSTKEDQLGVYVQDQIKFDRWVATIGGRYDNASADTLDGKAGTVIRQRDSAFTGRVGLNYLFDNGVTPYVAYSTAFQPQAGADFFNNVFKPTTGEQIEAGIKYQPPGSKTLITVAAFNIEQNNRLTADPDQINHLGKSVQVAGARVRGVEFEAKTELTRGFNLIASYAHLDHEVTKSINPAEIGRRLAQVPNDQAALWAQYEFQDGSLWGLALGGGVRYVGRTWDQGNTVITPDYTLFDARVSYDFGKLNRQLTGTTLSVNALNLFDKYYLTECTAGQGCTLGFRRTVLATMSYKW